MPDPHSPDGPDGVFVLPTATTPPHAKKWADLPYGIDSTFQKLDVYVPEGQGPWPTLVYVHGGAWMMCDKGDVQVEPALFGLARGWAVVSVNYRLSSEAKYPAQLEDVQTALRWVRTAGGEFGLDGTRVAVAGSSAGAHLAALAALHGGGNPEVGVCAAVLWYGPTNFLKMDPYLTESGAGVPDHGAADSPESRLLGAAIAEVPELVHRANPETWITPEAPPFLLQHGTADELVPWQLARDFAARLTAVLGSERVEFDALEGERHAAPAFATPENCRRTFAFLERWV